MTHTVRMANAMTETSSAVFILVALFDLMGNANFDGILSGVDGWQFKDRDNFLWFTPRPSITAFRFWMPDQIENFNLAFPDGFALKCLRYW